MTKKGYNTLGAPKNKWIVTFIDDLNMPVVDKFGDQPPLELLRYITENSIKLFICLNHEEFIKNLSFLIKMAFKKQVNVFLKVWVMLHL